MSETSPLEADVERERLLEALAYACAEHGYAGATPQLVAEAANLPRAVFARHFRSIHDAYLVLYGQATERLLAAVTTNVRACAPAPAGVGARGEPDIARWREQIEAGFAAALEFLAARPVLAAACIREAYAI